MSTDHEQQPWDIQGFWEGESRPGWSVGVTGNQAAIDYLTHSLVESDSVVFLLRRGRQVEVPEGQVGPYRLLDLTTARDELARHLYLDATPSMLRAGRADLWDNRPEYVDKEWAYRRADEIVAVLVGANKFRGSRSHHRLRRGGVRPGG